MSRLFGEICQNGYVVRDIEAAMAHWTEVLGVGPFFYVERVPFGEFAYRGEPSPVDVSIAVSASGPIQVELIQPRNDAPTVWRDFLDAGHEGLQHVSYWTTDFDERLTRGEAAGLEVSQSGWIGDERGRFAYFATEGPHPGTAVEISEVVGAKRDMFDAVAQQASSWDGSDPVRRVG